MLVTLEGYERFKSFSPKQLECFIKNTLDSSILNIEKEFDIEVLINTANGSPGQILENMKIDFNSIFVLDQTNFCIVKFIVV